MSAAFKFLKAPLKIACESCDRKVQYSAGTMLPARCADESICVTCFLADEGPMPMDKEPVTAPGPVKAPRTPPVLEAKQSTCWACYAGFCLNHKDGAKKWAS